jgi:NADH-quinone oxidoreductase subunit D
MRAWGWKDRNFFSTTESPVATAEKKPARQTVEREYPTGEILTLNMGPQHPSTHGVLRLVLDIEGETVLKMVPHVGYLHSGKEKIAEVKTYHKFIPYTDRLDYLSPMANNYAFVSAVEAVLEIEETERCKYLRTILCELARISSHLLWLGTHAMEVGAVTVFLYTFREREALYDLFEEICGARFTVSYMRVGGVSRDYPEGWLDRVRAFINDFPRRHKEYSDLLTMNDIFVYRTRGVGKITREQALDLCLTGPGLRASGVPWDIRKANPYLVYDRLDWNLITAEEGDCYARYQVRMQEMLESHKIVEQCLDQMPKDGPINIDNPKVMYPSRDRVKKSMEDLIHHFLLASEGLKTPAGEVYRPIEASKGELGFYIYTQGGSWPYRMHIRSPSFVNLQSLPVMCEGSMIADVVAVIGSLDLVLGEIDR